MKRGFAASGPVVAACAECGKPWGPAGKPFLFESIDAAMDFFVDGADGFGLYGDRLMCPDCLPLSLCFNPGHDWHMSIGAVAGGQMLIVRQCKLCGLYVAEVAA
ncbi:hypothetical protein ACWDYH_39885 [Nocardia goodfellowii]